MRNFNPEFKVHADSLAEIREGFDDVVKSLARGAIRWGRVRIKKVQVLNALILWFLKQPESLQREIIGEVMPTLRNHAESEKPLPIDKSVTSAITWSIASSREGNVTVLKADSLYEVRAKNGRKGPKVGT